MTGTGRSEIVPKNWWEVSLKNRREGRLVGGRMSKIVGGGRLAPQNKSGMGG